MVLGKRLRKTMSAASGSTQTLNSATGLELPIPSAPAIVVSEPMRSSLCSGTFPATVVIPRMCKEAERRARRRASASSVPVSQSMMTFSSAMISSGGSFRNASGRRCDRQGG